jgi:hypothetical protein
MTCADVDAATGYYVDDKAQRLESVEANLNRVLSQSPNNARARYCLGRVLVQSKPGAQGIAECERALALNPNLASAHALIGIAKLFNGHPEETESHESEALRVSHDNGSRCLGSLYRPRQAGSWRPRGGARLVSPGDGPRPKLRTGGRNQPAESVANAQARRATKRLSSYIPVATARPPAIAETMPGGSILPILKPRPGAPLFHRLRANWP